MRRMLHFPLFEAQKKQRDTHFTNLILYNKESVVQANQWLPKPKILPVLSTLDSIELPEYKSVPYLFYNLK